MEDTSVSLLDRIARENRDEDWQRLLSLYRPFIESQVRRYPQLADQVDDVVQNVCLVLMRELPEFKRQRTGSFRKWFRQVTVNQLRQASRQLSKTPIPSSELREFDLTLDQLLDHQSDASRKWDQEHDQELLQRIMQCVQQDTSSVHWQAFELHVLQGQPVEVVAAQLGISTNTVALVKSRLKKRMQVEAKGLLDD